MNQTEIDRRQQEWIVSQATGRALHVGCGMRPIAGAVNLDANPDRWAWADVAGDGARLPLRSGAFDSVVSSHVLEHLVDPVAALIEMARVLRPGGRMAHVVPDHRFTPHRESVRHPFAHHHHEWVGPEDFAGVVVALGDVLRLVVLESFPGFNWSFRVVMDRR